MKLTWRTGGLVATVIIALLSVLLFFQSGDPMLIVAAVVLTGMMWAGLGLAVVIIRGVKRPET